MLCVSAFDLGQGEDKYCTVYGPVLNRFPVISMSTCFHDKTVKTADNPIYNVLCVCVCVFIIIFIIIFVNVFCVF